MESTLESAFHCCVVQVSVDFDFSLLRHPIALNPERIRAIIFVLSIAHAVYVIHTLNKFEICKSSNNGSNKSSLTHWKIAIKMVALYRIAPALRIAAVQAAQIDCNLHRPHTLPIGLRRTVDVAV